MSIVAVTCPSCRRSFCINGRGKCRCGVYLVHHTKKNFHKLLPADMPVYVWVEEEKKWSLLVREEV